VCVCAGLCGHGTSAATDLADLTAAEAVEGLCARNFTAVEYNKALLDRIKAVECLNSFAAIDPGKVRPPHPGRPRARKAQHPHDGAGLLALQLSGQMQTAGRNMRECWQPAGAG
jgi:hypothetical protein